MKKKKRTHHKSGVSLIELMIVSSLIAVILGGVYMLWSSMAKSWVSERVKIGLNQDLHVAISQMKKEMRLSSGNEVFYYPSGSPPYSAVSLPVAKDTDNDDLIDVDADENIIWSENVIYHTYSTGGNLQLRKTVFSPRDNNLTSTERMEQLESVVTNGNGDSTYNSSNAKTKVLFNTLDSFEINPSLVTYDGYSGVLERSDFVKFGSVVLTPGTHTLRFEVTGKNTVSTDRKFAIDSLVFTPSGGEREAEEMTVSGTSGQSYSNVDLSSVGSWSGHAHLLYNAGSDGDYIELDFYYDQWIETNFDDPESEREDVLFEFDSSLSPPEVVLKLDGMSSTWDAETQTQGGSSQAYTESPPDYPSLSGLTMRTIIDSDSIQTAGARCRVLFRAHPSANNFEIISAYIEERSSGQDGDAGTKQQLYFSNTPVTIGSLQDMASGAVGTGPTTVVISSGYEVYSNWAEFPIDPEKDYLVSYYISSTAGNYSPSYYSGPAGSVNSYYRSGDYANASDWSGAGTNFRHIIGIVDMEVTHPSVGTWYSQIYDTKITNPTYNQMAWDDDEPANTDVTVSIRTSDFSDMADDPTWTDFTSSPAVISSSEVGRYVQFKIELTSDAPYFETPTMKWVSVNWPGEETVVDIGGYFSKNSDYGIIKLTVDGQELSKSLSVELNAKEGFLEKDFSSTISAEIEPRNTPQ